MSKKVVTCFLCAFVFIGSFLTGQAKMTGKADYLEYSFDAEVMMKKTDSIPSRLAWRNILYAENLVAEGSSQEYLIKAVNIKKGYSGFTLYQPESSGNKTFSVSTNGKDQKFVPGKYFTQEGGLVWISFTAPDKKKYCLPTAIKIISIEEYEKLNKDINLPAFYEEPLAENESEVISEALDSESADEETAEEIKESSVSETENIEEQSLETVSETEIQEIAFAENSENMTTVDDGDESGEKEEQSELGENESETEIADGSEGDETESESSSEAEEVPFEKGDFKFVRDSRNFPSNGKEMASFVGINKQNVEPESNVVTLIKNLPDGTKPKLFFMDGLEVLVYIAPDVTLRTDDNCYSLFYSTRRYGREEDFSIPKRIIENPKINGKLTNMLDFDGAVTTVGGKQKLVLVWTQCTIQNTDETSEEDLLKKTAIYWSSWKENDKVWEKADCISELKGSLQFDPVLQFSDKNLCLKIRNRPDNTLTNTEENPAFAEKQIYFVLNKKGVWETAGAGQFENTKTLYPVEDANNSVSENYQYVYNRQGILSGCFWNDGTKIYAKAYLKSPDTKKMMWTESVSVIYQAPGRTYNILYPHAEVRDSGEWIFTYLRETEEGNNICISKVNNEPCMVTTRMIPDLRDLQKPGNSVHFTVTVQNLGLGIANGLELVIRNEFKTEAGNVAYKNNFYPGTTYELQGIYQKLKGKDGVVPVEDIYADIKLPKMKRNSEFAFYNARYTMGIPKLAFGDIFVLTKGKSQKVIYTLGTSNGIKVKAPNTEIVITEHSENPAYEDNSVTVAVEEPFSDTYLEMDFDYETAEFDEKSFTFNALFHYEKERRKIPGWDPEEVEKETAIRTSCEVLNPIYMKPAFYGAVLDTAFNKKDRIMTCDFVVSNNWPEAISDIIKLELVNISTGKIEQNLEVPFDLDILENKKGTVSFVPALTDVAGDYIVRIKK